MPKFTTEETSPIVKALIAKINESYAQIMGGTPTLMAYANGLHSTFQGGPNAYWNPKALKDVDRVVVGANTEGLLSLGSQNFSFLYNKCSRRDYLCHLRRRPSEDTNGSTKR